MLRSLLLASVLLLAVAAVHTSARVDDLSVLSDVGAVPTLESVLSSLPSAEQHEAAHADNIALLSLDDLSPTSLAMLHAAARHGDSEHAAALIEMEQQHAQQQQQKQKQTIQKQQQQETTFVQVSEPGRKIQQLSGPPAAGGVDEWTLDAKPRPVFRAPFGDVIGNLPPGAQLVIESYYYGVDNGDQALFGWGFIKSPIGGFGGWAGSNSCGWFPLQRIKTPDAASASKVPVEQWANLITSATTIKAKCPSAPIVKQQLAAVAATTPVVTNVANEILTRSSLFQDGSYFNNGKNDGAVIAATSTNACPTFLNYDPASKATREVGPVLAKGVFSGAGTIGNAPNVEGKQTTGTLGFGVKFVTKDGKFALIHHPTLDNGVNSNFFVAANCVAFDTNAVKLTAKSNAAAFVEVTAAADSYTQYSEPSDSYGSTHQRDLEAAIASQEAVVNELRQQHEAATSALIEAQSQVQEHEEEAAAPMLMETEAEAEIAEDPLEGLHNQGARGNYPGWTSFVETAQAPNAAAAAAPVAAAAVAAPDTRIMAPAVAGVVGPSVADPVIQHVQMSNGHARHSIKAPALGFKKLQVHVYRKTDDNLTTGERMSNAVRRLALNQATSFKKINHLIAELRRCSRSSTTSACLPQITGQLEDWRAEWHGDHPNGP